MLVDLAKLKPSDVYRTMVQTLVPRPIAWVLSDNGDGEFNLAPFSYFNAVASDPPLLMLMVGKKRDGSHKDTRVNIEQRRHFVVHIPSTRHIDAVNNSSASLDFGDSEVSRLDLDTVEFAGSRLPRLRDCGVAYACSLYRMQQVGGVPMSMILGEIHQVYIDDQVLEPGSEKLAVDAMALDPLARLGGTHYASLGRMLSRPRPE